MRATCCGVRPTQHIYTWMKVLVFLARERNTKKIEETEQRKEPNKRFERGER